MELQTKSLHAGAIKPRDHGSIVTPVFQTSTFEYHGEDYHDIRYMRLSNTPNHIVLGERIAALEEAEAALVTGSGMAAISGVLLSLLSAGDHLLVQDCLYGGTNEFVSRELARLGVTRTVIDVQKPESWTANLQDTTRAIYVETLTNPLIQLADLESVAAFAKKNGLISIIDNTFASPVNCRPMTLGFDIVVESCTKYMSGHSDLIAGSVAGSAAHVRRVKKMLDHLGGHLDAHACFLLERGLKTLALRVRHQSASAGEIARFLAGQPAVATVNYPGLRNHAQHERAARLLDGFGGMLSFELQGGVDQAEAFLSKLTLPANAPSLGGAESLIVRPAAAVHGRLSPEERGRIGITDGLIRFSVGLEATADLLGDIQSALAAAQE